MSDPIVDGYNLDALNYTIKVPYNGSIATGGDSRHANLNIFYEVCFPVQMTKIDLTQFSLETSPG